MVNISCQCYIFLSVKEFVQSLRNRLPSLMVVQDLVLGLAQGTAHDREIEPAQETVHKIVHDSKMGLSIPMRVLLIAQCMQHSQTLLT